MPLYRSFRFQLRLKPAQERTLRRWAGQLRWIWNRAIERQEERRKAGEKHASYYDMAAWLTAWRHAPETAWLADGPVQCQQHALQQLDRSYRQFFLGNRGKPRPKKRGRDPGFRFPDPTRAPFDPSTSRVRLPKIGWVRIRHSRPIEYAILNASVSTDGVKWYVSFECQLEETIPAANIQPTLGIDL